MKLTNSVRIVQRSRLVDVYLYFPIRLRSLVLDQLGAGTTLPLPLRTQCHGLLHRVWEDPASKLDPERGYPDQKFVFLRAFRNGLVWVLKILHDHKLPLPLQTRSHYHPFIHALTCRSGGRNFITTNPRIVKL
jgi:hypothetical protein